MCVPSVGDDGLPDAGASVAAASRVVEWVREWRVDGAGVEVPGACVTLRLDGRVIGRGVAMGGAGSALGDATRVAMVRALPGLPPDWEVRSGAARERVAIAVELAGALVPLEGDSDAELALGVSPGLDGVAVRVGERVAARFPLRMLAARENSASAVRSLVSELAQDPSRGLAEVGELRGLGYSFYRFRTVQMAQTDPRVVPIFLHRGGRVVELGEVDMSRLRSMADGMASHLLMRRWPGVEAYGLMGMIDPVTGRAESRFEHPGGQALAISALARYARTRGVDAQVATEAKQAVDELITELARVEEGEIAAWDDAGSAAATIVALTDARGPGGWSDAEVVELHRRCRERVIASVDVRSGAFVPETGEGAWGVVALAMVRLWAAGDETVSVEVADRTVRAAFRETPPARLVSHFPWLGWADMELAGERGAVKAASALLETRRLIDEHQLDAMSLAPEDRDLAGAVVFTSGGSVLPNWNSIRPLPLLADMLGDERLTGGTLWEGEAASELGHLLGLVRFTNQLAAGRAESFMYARSDRSLWGVRMALWDARMPVESTAMGLEGACRALDAVEALARRNGAAPEGGKGPD